MHVQQCINKKLKLQLLKAHTENRNYKAEHQCILNCSSHKLKTYTSQTANRVLLILTTKSKYFNSSASKTECFYFYQNRVATMLSMKTE
jgi:hypothetical protein